MKRPSSKHIENREFSTILEDEGGFYLTMMALCLVSIIFVIALGIDSSALYLHQARLQRSSDAGTIAGTLQLVDGLDKSDVEGIAGDVAKDNLWMNGVTFNNQDVTSTVVSTSDEMSVRVSSAVELDTLVMGRWVKGVLTNNAGGAAKGIRQPVAVTLVLDTTGSMSQVVCENGTCIPKLEALKNSARAFVQRFDENRDRLAIVSFAQTSTVRHSIGAPFVKNDLIAAIDSMTATGGTGIRGGLYAARQDFQNPQCGKSEAECQLEIDTYKKVIVLITDGAPSVLDTTNPSVLYPAGCNPIEHDIAADSFGNIRPQAQFEALREAEDIRSLGVTIFTIGIGLPDQAPTSPGREAFQDSFDPYVLPTDGSAFLVRLGELSVKTVFLSHIANDPSVQAYSIEYPGSCVRKFAETAAEPRGAFTFTTDPEVLKRLLDRIASTILMRLTE